MTLLILGGTGNLGRQIVRKALQDGFQVRCIVRNKKAAQFLNEWGAELVYGDLSRPESLPLSFQGVTAVIDASTTRPEDDLRVIDVDWYGKLMLLEMAKQVQVKRFIFFSIVNAQAYPRIPLMQQKARFEQLLQDSGVSYTIFQCAGFYQALIHQYAIPILEGKSVWKTSDLVAVSYIDTEDAARFCLKSLFLKSTENKSFFLGGPQAWTSAQIIALCERLSGQKAQLQGIPIFFLKLSQQVAGFFEWTAKISERLSFVQLLENDQSTLPVLQKNLTTFHLSAQEILPLDAYLRGYFEMMLVSLENLNVEAQSKQKGLIL